MSEKPEKPETIRISVTMTKTYLNAMDYLVAEGLYLSRGEIILESLRSFLKRRGIGPFAEPPKAEE